MRKLLMLLILFLMSLTFGFFNCNEDTAPSKTPTPITNVIELPTPYPVTTQVPNGISISR